MMPPVSQSTLWPLAVSNIAWAGQSDDHFLAVLSEEGAQGVELAASLVWPEPVESTPNERRQWRQKVESYQLRTAGLHALLYTRPDLQLLDEGLGRQRVLNYLLKMLDVCVELGGACLVLGSPRNRRRNGLPYAEARERAISVLAELAHKTEKSGCCFVLEALPEEICDFINTLEEAAAIVQLINSAGLRLHFDTGAVGYGVEDDPSLMPLIKSVVHCHLNDRILLPPGSEEPEKHHRWARLFTEASYQGWFSIEMRQTETPEMTVRQAIQFAQSTYGTGRSLSSDQTVSKSPISQDK